MAESSSFELLTDKRNESFSKLLKKSYRLDIASAYVSSKGPWEQIEKLAKEKKIEVRMVVGLEDALTSPEVLGTDLPGIDVKGYLKYKGGIFHPKLYIFHTNSGTKEVFLGSANFTQGGFEKNEEILLHITDPKIVEQCQEYFNEIWTSRNVLKLSPLLLAKYSKQNEKRESRKKESKVALRELWGAIMVNDFLSAPSDGSFLEYCSLIFQLLEFPDNRLEPADTYNTGSKALDKLLLVLDMLEECHHLIASQSNQHERDDILKIKGTKKPYCFLGRGKLIPLFSYSNRTQVYGKEKQSRDIMQYLQNFSLQKPVINISEAQFVLEILSSYKNIKTANSSRLMSLSRPDLVFSYNKASAKVLEEMAHLGPAGENEEKKRKSKFIQLLEFVWDRPWYKNKPGSLNEVQERIWNNRAAMIDVLVYEEFWNSNDKGTKPVKEKIRRFFNLSPKKLK